jgi:hypothetical protein
MKKFWLLLLPAFLFLVSCSKEEVQRPPIDESEWLQKDRGFVVASSFNCDFFVVETARGYSVLRNWGGFAPIRGAVLYGNHDSFGLQTFYNRSEGYLMNADIRDRYLGYFQAIDQANWYCGAMNPGFGSFSASADSTYIHKN